MHSNHRLVRRTACALAVAALCLAAIPTSPVRAAVAAPAARLDADRFLSDYQLVTLDPAATMKRVQSGQLVTIQAGLDRFDLRLEPNDLRAPNYRAQETLEDGTTRTLEMGPVETYKGTVENREGASARFTIQEGRMVGMILDGGETYFVEPLSTYSLAGGPTDYLVYRGADVRPEAEPGTCGTTEAHKVSEALAGVADKANETQGTSVRVVQLATETDNEYVSALGSASSANADILSVVNQIDGVYEAELGLSFTVVLQNTYSGSDPYSSNTNASTILTEFQNRWNSAMSGVQRDLTHMWTGKDMAGSTVGIAYVGVVCNAASYSYGVSQRFSSAPQRYVLTAHEIGHNFSACHSDTSCNPNPSSCNNTIMQSFVGTGFTFCTFSRGQINAHVNANGSCLSTGTGGGGGPTVPAAPSNLTATRASNTRINLAWTDNANNETGFRIERSTNGGAFVEIGTVGANVTAVGNTGLRRRTTYTYRLRSYNSAGNSAYSNSATATTRNRP